MKRNVLGLLLVAGGAVLPFLMACRILEPSFFLAFVSFAASTSGLALGIACVARRLESNSRE